MDERIRLIIEAQNRANPAFQAVTRGMTTISAGAKAAGEAVGRASVNIRNTLTTVGHACQQAGAAFVRMGQTAKAGLDMIAGPLKNVTTGLAAIGAAGTGALAAFGVLGVKSNIFKENTLAALTGMTKSKVVAEDLYKFLTKFADTTPFDDEEIVSAGKALMTFGFDAKRVLTLVGDTAFTMKVPLEQVVNTLAKLKAGTFDTAEMGPVGLSREGLESMGQTFSAGGEPEQRAALLGQGMALLQQKFGGAMASGASGFDAAFSTMESNFKRVAAMATSGIFESLKRGFDAVSASLVKFMESGGAIGGLGVIFDGIGKAIQLAAKQGEGFVAWLDQVVSREGVATFLSNVLGLLQTIGESVLKTFGVDLKAAMDPKNVGVFFDALATGADGAISAFFGIGRVGQEMVRILISAFEDMGDRVSDIMQDVGFSLKSLFLGMQFQLAEMTASMLENLGNVLRNIPDIGIGDWRPFAGIRNAGEDMGIQARGMSQPGGQIDQLFKQRLDLATEMAAVGSSRSARAQQRLAADPYRNDGFFKRIGDSFAGRPGQTGGEDEFRTLLQKNILGVAKALFAGAAATAPPAAPFPGAPMLYGGGGGRGSVSYPRSMTPAIPSMPGYLDPGMGGVGTGDWTSDFIRRRDAGWSNGGGGGGTAINVNVNAMVTRESLIQAAEEAYEELVRRGIAGPSGF